MRFFFTTLLSVFIVLPCYAFKIDTHVWVANQLIAELNNTKFAVKDKVVSPPAMDGVSINLGSKIVPVKSKGFTFNLIPVVELSSNPTFSVDLDDDLVRSILQHPEYFRMGAIGPDAFPDVLIGQMIVHPGVEKSWGTAEWLRFLSELPKLSAKERAFVAGFHVHVATDVFAHTFVNKYAGDTFDLHNHKDPSTRHILLESYISKYTPKSLNFVEELTDKETGKLAIPVEFLQRAFHYESRASHIYKKGEINHLNLIYGMKEKLENLVSSDGPIQKIENFIIDSILKSQLGVDLTNKQIQRIKELAEKVKKDTNVVGEILKLNSKLDEKFIDLSVDAKKQFNRLNKEVDRVSKDLIGYIKEAQNIELKITNTVDELAALPLTVVVDVVEKVCKEVKKCSSNDLCKIILSCTVTCRMATVCHDVIKKVEKDNPRIPMLQSELVKMRHRLTNELADKIVDSKNNLVNLTNKLFDITTMGLQFRKMNNNLLKNAYSKYGLGISPIRTFIENWIVDIDIAMKKFIYANGEVIVNTVGNKRKAISPYISWVKNDLPTVFGIPSTLIGSVNSYKDFKVTAESHLSSLMKISSDTLPVGSYAFEFYEKINDLLSNIQKQITDSVIKEGIRAASRVSGVDILYWKDLFTEEVNENKINAVFSKSGKMELRAYDTITNQLRDDLGINSNSRSFDPVAFSAIHDAIVLSKLSLLNADGLNNFVSVFNLSAMFNNYDLGRILDDEDYYIFSIPQHRNILYGFVKNIDGNHQWLPLAPPFLRKEGSIDGSVLIRKMHIEKRFGYSKVHGENYGMKAREFFFDKANVSMFDLLFKGKYDWYE